MDGWQLSVAVLGLGLGTVLVGDAGRRIALAVWTDDRWLVAVATVVYATSIGVVLLEVIGVFGGLYPWIWLAACAAAWLPSWVVTRRRSLGARMVPAPTQMPRLSTGEAVLAMALLILVGLIVARYFSSLSSPQPEFDVVAGHLPVAVQWLQAHNLRFLPYVSPVSIEAQYPANAELAALWLMLPVHRDFLVQLASLPGVAMAVAGVAAAARKLGARPLIAIGVGLVIPTLPRFLGELVGTNMEDMFGIGGMAAALAFLTVATSANWRAAAVSAGLGAGLALGARYAALLAVPPLALLLLVEILRRRQRIARGARALAMFGAATLVTGGFWYVRNLVLTGDPVFPQPVPWRQVNDVLAIDLPRYRSYLTLGVKPLDWAHAVIYALHYDGFMFVLLIAVAAGSPLLLIRRLGRWGVAWPWAVLPFVALLAFVAQPGSAGYLHDNGLDPVLQALTLRYALLMLPPAAIVFGVILSRLPADRAELATGAILLAGAASTMLQGYHRSSPIAMVLAVAAMLGVSGAWLAIRQLPRGLAVALGVGIILLAVVAAPMAQAYDSHRLASGLPYEPQRLQLEAGDQSIAVAGLCQLYGLYGPDLQRRVEYLTGADDGYNRPLATTYSQWAESLRTHHATALLVSVDVCLAGRDVPQAGWAQDHPAAFRVVSRDGPITLYRVDLAALGN